MPTLLVLGTMVDPHIERVVLELRERGNIEVHVLDFLNEESSFSLEVDGCGEWRLSLDGAVLGGDYLVWDRSKLIYGTAFYVKGDGDGRGFAAEEWRALYRLVSGIHEERTVNALRLRACLLKPYQQVLAAQAGFKVPPSIVTNSKANVTTFAKGSNGSVIMKSLSGTKVKPPFEGDYIPYNVLTMRVSDDDIAGATVEQIQYCPHFLQHEIQKDFELRIVVVDGAIIPFRINSQGHAISKVDWRKGLGFVKFSPSELTDSLRVKIDGFMARSGLFCGSMDIVIDREGEPWFLEINPEGAWGWLDDLVEGRVTRTFADAFERYFGIVSHAEQTLSAFSAVA